MTDQRVQRLSRRSLAAVTSLVVPVLVVISIWLPLVAYYSVPDVPVADAVVAEARSQPSDAILREVGQFSLFPVAGRGPEMDVGVAEGILQGQLALPGLPAASIGLPFSPDDLDGLPASLQLRFAGYAVPDFLVAAFEATGRDEFLAMARDTIVAWDRYEQSARLPKGYLWNDHATSARVRVLGEFWRAYRQRPDYDPAVGRAVLRQAARYRAFLSDPAHFTFATNHGLMENLALLQLELDFPTLPDGARYRQLAVDRLGQQLAFLIDDEGVVHENSAGYQSFGLEVLGMTFRCLTLLDIPVSPEWKQKYERGLDFLASLQRPDGTLPATGDTDGESQGGSPPVTDIDGAGRSSPLHARAPSEPGQPLAAHPAAGYWVEWDGLDKWPDPYALSQTVVTWTRPPAPSHKHADELSVVLWSRGVSWVTGVGYWPYEDLRRATAESWAAANAPHLANEATTSERTADLLSSGSTAELSALDLERRGPGTYLARRQVVHLKPDLWVIVDHVEGDARSGNETVWTMDPTVQLQAGQTTGSFVLEAPGGAAAARMTVLGSAGTEVRDYRGSNEPFAGWHVIGSVPRPAPAVVVAQPAGDAWTVVVLSTAAPGSAQFYAGGVPEMSPGNTADAWTVTLPIALGDLTVTRAAGTLTVDEHQATGHTTSVASVSLEPGPAAGPGQTGTAFAKVAADYPVFQERISARTKVTLALAGLLVAQLVLLFVVWQRWPGLVVPLLLVSTIGWVAVAASLHFLILPSWEVLLAT